MAIQYKDYYGMLGIPREADTEEVRRAFRHLARLCHPDIAGNDRRAEERFKEINEAYEVLGDRERRRRYDEFNANWDRLGDHLASEQAWQRFAAQARPPEFASGGPREPFTFRSAALSDLLDQLFQTRPKSARARAAEREAERLDGRGDDLEADIWVSLAEVAAGSMRQIAMQRAARCKECLGLGQLHARPCPECRGAGSVPASIRCTVKIPSGVSEGAFLRVAGKGDEGVPGSEPGDLFLKVQYSPHPRFRFENGRLVCELTVAPWEAVLGSQATVPGIDAPVNIRVPAGTQNGQMLRVRGRGLPSAEGAPGDLFVRVNIQVPTGAQERERQLWEELARASGAPNPDISQIYYGSPKFRG